MKHNLTFFILLIIIIVGDLFFKIISVDILFAIIIFSQFYFLNKFENAFILILFMSIISGAYFTSRGLDGIGGFSYVIGILFIFKEIYKIKATLLKKYIPFLFILLLFFLSNYIHINGIIYESKSFTIFINGTLAFIVISIFNLYIHKIRFKALGAIFIVFGAFLLRLCIDINNLPGPDTLLHFGFMRYQTYIYQANAILSQGDFTISYHVPGFLSLIGLSFILIDNNFRLTKSTIFFIFFSFLIIFYTGARQNLLGFFVLLIYFFTTLSRENYIIRLRLYLVYIFIIFFVLLELLPILSSETMDSTIAATGRQIHYLKGLDYFNENPLNGIGIGFHDYGGKANYPHNLFIELLAEVGIIGVLLTLLLTIYSIVKNNRNKKINSKYIILIIPFLIRAMISGSLTTNIIFFSLLFSMHFLPSFRSKQSKI